jgi:hypothetical protein
MATRIKTRFLKGIWIKNWKFKISEKPFNSKMTSTQISNTMHKIEKFAEKTLRNQLAWEAVNKPFHNLIFMPSWKEKPITRPVNMFLTVTIVDPQQPPETSVVAPPPPKQPKGL